MKAIQCLSSMPMLQGRQMNGTFEKDRGVGMPEAVLKTLRLSAMSWRLNNGFIKLYTDTPMREYLEKNNMLECWDLVDTELLDSFYKCCGDINFSVFWSAGKFACYLQEKAPFVCIDTDIIIWKHLKFDKDLDFGFAHWERIGKEDENYPNISMIEMPDTFDFSYYYDELKICDSHACNMAITYFGNDKFRKEFAGLALDFMRGNPVNAGGKYATPELLFIEQRVPLIMVCRNHLNYAPVIPCTWSPKEFRIVHPGKHYKDWFFANLDTSKTFTHLWFHKKYLSENPEENARYCERLEDLYKEAEAKLADSKNIDYSCDKAIYVSHMVCVQGCSKCSYMVWLKEDDPDFTDALRSYTGNGLCMSYCIKYAKYLGPYPPHYLIGNSDNASI